MRFQHFEMRHKFPFIDAAKLFFKNVQDLEVKVDFKTIHKLQTLSGNF